MERCMKRAETSGRADDNPETMKNRVNNFFEHSQPVVDYYKQFGKVHTINATGSIQEVYTLTKRAILPECFCLLGPKASGKTTIGHTMSARVNIKVVDFLYFIRMNGLRGKEDEILVDEFIQFLSREQASRVLLENFPQNVNQAKFFMRNGTKPTRVFTLECSKDTCQERMYTLGETNPMYIKSAILSKKIKKYYEDAAQLIPFFEESANHIQINSDREIDNTMNDIYKHIEPTIIHVRPGGNAGDLCKDITTKLSQNHGYQNLDIKKVIVGECERNTDIGKELVHVVKSSKIISSELIIRMLKKIIYSG